MVLTSNLNQEIDKDLLEDALMLRLFPIQESESRRQLQQLER